MTRAINSRTWTRWWRRPWIIPLLVVILAFLAYQVNRFWGVWDTSRAPVSPHGDYSFYFPLLGTHIVCGFTAMFTAAIQVWPRIRRDHPVVHRASGRIYVVVTLAGGTAALFILRFAPPVGRVGAIVETVLWMTTAALGFAQARRGNYVAHRQLMLYSFATLMSTVWGTVIAEVGLALPVPVDAVYLNYLFEAARWAGFLANLMIVQWWLLRTANRPIEFDPTNRRAAAPILGRVLPVESD
jgi:uncharacterized membrane protein